MPLMKRRTALKRLAAGAGSTFALVGSASASDTEPKNLEDVEFKYRVTDAGIEEVESDDGFCERNPDCCVYDCSDCPDDCYDGCRCAG
jgi:hypothetical protein